MSPSGPPHLSYCHPTRPDNIVYFVHILSQFIHASTYWPHGCCYQSSSISLKGSPEKAFFHLLQVAFVILIRQNVQLVSWKSTKYNTISRYSLEAEYQLSHGHSYFGTLVFFDGSYSLFEAHFFGKIDFVIMIFWKMYSLKLGKYFGSTSKIIL